MAYAEDSGDITFAFAGDAMPTRRISVHAEPEFLAVAELLRGADVSIANSETLYHQFEGYPVADAGLYGTYVTTHPDVIDDLRWLGLDMVATANNHCVDYGELGLLANIDNLDARGLPQAGTGRSLTEAARPRYLQTARGTVAMVAVTLTMPPGDHRAGEPRGAVKARPGANVLRHTVAHEVPPEGFQTLLDLGANLGLGRPHFRRDGDTLNFLGRSFTVGAEYRTVQLIYEFDLELNLSWIAEARQLADWVVVSMHCHESGATREDPPDFAVEFAHRALDAGGDIVFGHGPHLDRGIELYQGKPIFYALGNFIIQNETIPQQPWDFTQRFGLPPTATTGEAYRVRDSRSRGGLAQDPIGLQSAVAEVEFRGGRLAEIRLHPVDLGLGTPRRRRAGRPMLARGETATAIIERFARLSARYGTKVELVSEPAPLGVITIPAIAALRERSDHMRLALNMPLLDRSGAALDAAGIGRRARLMEKEGFDGIWLGDSFSPGMTRPDPLMWLLVAAAATSRIEVGTSILIVPLRDPVELAQRFLTLQQLTGGRFTVGVGSGSTRSNYEALGRDFDGRFAAMKADLEVIRALCRGEHAGEAFLNPWPTAVPGPPIVIGAWHSGIWLKRAVEQYDGWMCSAGRTNLRTMREAIKRYRDLGGKRAIISSCMIDLTAPTTPMGADDPFHLRCDPKEAAMRLHQVAELGFDDVLLVKQDHTRSRILHGAPAAGRTLSIYESDYDDEELPLIRSLIERDTRGPWENG